MKTYRYKMHAGAIWTEPFEARSNAHALELVRQRKDLSPTEVIKLDYLQVIENGTFVWVI